MSLVDIMEMPAELTKELVLTVAVIAIAMILIILAVVYKPDTAFGEQSSVSSAVKEEWEIFNSKKSDILVMKPLPDLETKTLKISIEPVIKASEEAGGYKYTVDTGGFELIYTGENPESIRVVPVLYYQENTAAEIFRLTGKTTKISNIQFSFISKKPCAKKVYTTDCLRKDDAGCWSYSGDLALQQGLLFRDHIVTLNVVADYPIVSWGPCRVQFTVECRDEYKMFWMNECGEHKPYPCKKSVDMCGSAVTIDLTGSSLDCKERVIKNLVVSTAKSDAEPWMVAGSGYIGFWKYSEDPAGPKCWEHKMLGTLDEDCFEQYLGMYKINIPLENYEDGGC